MPTRYRLCCLTKNKTNPAYEGARIGAARLAKDLNCELVSFTPDVPDSVEEQDAQLVEALNLRPDAVMIAPAHTSALDHRLNEIRDAGIPLFFFVTSSDMVKAETFVTSDNHTLAVGIANHLFEHLGGKGDVVILEGIESSPTTAPRTNGFREAADTHSGINIVASRAGDYQYDDARRVMTDILAEHSDIAGVLAANDFMAFGAIDALQDSGRDAAVIGLNAMPDAVTAIKDGRLLATVGYDAMTMTCLAMHAAHQFLSGEAVPAIVELPGDIIHAGNCDDWDLPYAQRRLPPWELALRYAKR